MASLAITFQSVCAGGCHMNVGASIDGGPTVDIRIDANELLTPLSASDAPGIVLGVMRVKFRGMTRAQASAGIQSGFTITI